MELFTLAFEGHLVSHEVEDEGAHGPHITLQVVGAAEPHLRRHVLISALKFNRHGALRIEHLADAEIAHFHNTRLRQKHVVRLDVSV